jgi:hypothetical protein
MFDNNGGRLTSSAANYMVKYSDGQTGLILREWFVNPGEAPAKPASPKRQALDDAWKIGNIIEFTVKDGPDGPVEATLGVADDGKVDVYISAGCKKAKLDDIADCIVSIDDNRPRLRARIDQIRDDQRGGVRIPGTNDYIAKDEARYYFDDVVVISTPEPEKRPDVTVTLTADDAEKAAALIGRTLGCHAPYKALIDAGVEPQVYQVQCHGLSGVEAPSLVLVKKGS